MDAEATEKGLPPRTPETVSSVGDGSNSAVKSATTASLSQSKEQSKVVPRYLRPSKGSCHDFCKYGRKHSLRLRGKYPCFPSFAGSRSAPEKENHRVKIPSLAEKRKKSAARARQKSSAHLKAGLCDKHVMLEEGSASPVDTIKLAEESEIIDRFLENYGLSLVLEATDHNLPSPSKKIEPSSESESSKRGTSTEGTVLCDDPGLSAEEMSLRAKKAEASRDPDTAKKATKKVGAFSSIKSKLVQKVPSPIKKALSSGSGKSKARDLVVSASSAKKPDAFAKPGPSGKPKDTTAKSMPPLNPSSGTASKKSEIRRTRNVDLPNHDGKKKPKPPPSSLSSQPILNRISSISLRRVKITRTSSVRRPKNLEKAKEESPNVVEPRAEVDKTSVARRPSAVPNQGKQHKVPVPASVSKQGGTLVARAAQIEDKKSRRKGATSQPEDGDPASSRPELRRGKVVDPQSVDDVARRIWFRQGRRTGDNPGSKSGRRSFRIRDRGRVAANPPRPGGEIVVLRHQDTPEREVQGLFNEVIEETAKKLSKSKKSKVRALVGAFETVISLQEALRFEVAVVKPRRPQAS